MNERDHLLSLIELVYAAPGTRDGWQAFLERFCTVMRASGVHFISVGVPSQHASVSLTVRTDPAALVAYRDYWGAHDPWGHGLAALSPSAGSVVVGDQLISHTQLKTTEYYNEFSRSIDMVRALIGTIETGPGAVSVISINGSERRGPFEQDDAALLTALMPHLHRGLSLHRRLATSDTLAADLESVVNRADRAILLVDAAGQVTFMNQAAERVVATRDGLTVEDGEIRAASAADTSRLRELLAAAVATSTGVGMSAGATLAVGRRSGRRPLLVLIAPVPKPRSSEGVMEGAAAIVVVSDPERTAIPDEHMLRTLFGLTMSEARLACALLDGLDIQQASARLGIRNGTARTRLKTIFEKTGVHRQAELVRLLLTHQPTY